MLTKILSPNNMLLLGVILLVLFFLQALTGIITQTARFAANRKNLKQNQQLFDLKLKAVLDQLQKHTGLTRSWNGFRKFEVTRKEKETHNVCSFYLQAHDKKPIASFKPGQYLTFQFSLNDKEKAIRHCYSLSESPRIRDYYRVSIKKLDNGEVSGYFHENIKVGYIVDVMAPAGHFVLNEDSTRPVVILSLAIP